jgi:hypothetical protein
MYIAALNADASLGWDPVGFISWQERVSVSKLNTAYLNDDLHLFAVTGHSDLTADLNTATAGLYYAFYEKWKILIGNRLWIKWFLCQKNSIITYWSFYLHVNTIVYQLALTQTTHARTEHIIDLSQ